jgi:hypothetical protein
MLSFNQPAHEYSCAGLQVRALPAIGESKDGESFKTR